VGNVLVDQISERQPDSTTGRFRRLEEGLLSPNAGKRAAEKYYFCFFLVSLPVQAVITSHLSFAKGSYNDPVLLTMGILLGGGAWFGSLLFRARADRGRAFYEVYGFKLGCFLAVWAMVGGYLGTAPWYSVLHGHFAFNTQFNPNGVPLFFLPMTIAVFGFYTVVLGVLFRVIMRLIMRAHLVDNVPQVIIRVVIAALLSPIVPVLETLFYHSRSYCFDSTSAGMWFLNILVYGIWQFSALLFYPQFDEDPGDNQPVSRFFLSGFAVVGILLFGNELVTEFIAPHFTHVATGAVNVNDWSSNNCLGPRPAS
jgi:hypothetical protein